MKVLITGAAGFIGRYVAKEFSSQGYEVVGMGWGKFPDHILWGVSTWHECEVTLETLCAFANTPDVIVHCAGGSSVGDSVEYPRQDFCRTVDETSYVLEYMRLHNPDSKLIYPSSAAVYGQVRQVPIPETADCTPVSPYGVHKRMAEELCQLYATRYGLSIAIVRLFSIYGEGLRKQLLWDACNKLALDNVEFFGTGEEVRDWLHVRDAARILNLAVGHTSSNYPVVNAGTGEGLRVKDVLNILRNCMGVEKELVFSSVQKTGDPDVLLADVQKLMGWGFKTSMSFEDEVSKYVQWYKQCL